MIIKNYQYTTTEIDSGYSLDKCTRMFKKLDYCQPKLYKLYIIKYRVDMFLIIILQVKFQIFLKKKRLGWI